MGHGCLRSITTQLQPSLAARLVSGAFGLWSLARLVGCRIMHSLDRPRSNSAISLHELDAQSRFRVNHRSISYSSGSHGPPSQDQGSGQGNDQDQDRDRDHDDGRGHHHNSSEPRGAGTAGTAGSEPGDASETPPPWQERPVSRLATFWGSHVSCEVDFDACRDHLGTHLTFIFVIFLVLHMLHCLAYHWATGSLPSGMSHRN